MVPLMPQLFNPAKLKGLPGEKHDAEKKNCFGRTISCLGKVAEMRQLQKKRVWWRICFDVWYAICVNISLAANSYDKLLYKTFRNAEVRLQDC